MQILLQDYPRAAWPNNPHYAQSIQNWMGAHSMFRHLGRITNKSCESYLDEEMEPEKFGHRLAYYGDIMVKNLHGHHTWENREFFPELRNADSRFNKGLETLESDHICLDETLGGFTKAANRVIKLIHLDEKQARNEAKHLHEYTQDINAILARHLQDEEDLVVPILLHHKLRG